MPRQSTGLQRAHPVWASHSAHIHVTQRRARTSTPGLVTSNVITLCGSRCDRGLNVFAEDSWCLDNSLKSPYSSQTRKIRVHDLLKMRFVELKNREYNKAWLTHYVFINLVLIKESDLSVCWSCDEVRLLRVSVAFVFELFVLFISRSRRVPALQMKTGDGRLLVLWPHAVYSWVMMIRGFIIVWSNNDKVTSLNPALGSARRIGTLGHLTMISHPSGLILVLFSNQL